MLASIIESCEISETKKVMKELDKLERIGEDAIKTNLRVYADSNKILTLFKLMEKPLSFFEENAFEGVFELIDLEKECKKYNLKVEFNPFLARGLEYYTGNIFEVKESGKSSIAGGGRYDKTVGKYLKREIPAVGISFGLERVCAIAKITPESIPKIMVISIEQEAESMKLIKNLRKFGISCIFSDNNVGKSLEYADAYSIPYVIFVGEEEIEKKKVKLKNMSSGKEEFLSEKQVLNRFS